MIAEAKQSYPGVICIHCHQPTPLTSTADGKERKSREHREGDSDEFAIFASSLRCRWCHSEGVYTAKDVREFEGQPRKRARRHISDEK
jgi:hypothetical protein